MPGHRVTRELSQPGAHTRGLTGAPTGVGQRLGLQGPSAPGTGQGPPTGAAPALTAMKLAMKCVTMLSGRYPVLRTSCLAWS